MKQVIALTLGLLAAAAGAQAAGPKLVFIDLSTEQLMDHATAKAILAEAIPARVWKIYPASKWGFASQVEGGFTQAKVCVVTARAMLAPLTLTKAMLLRPEKQATAFDALPNATAEQCRQLAKDKLREAIHGVVSSLVEN